MFEAHDAILAVDVGGTNIRAGVGGAQPEEGVPTCPKRRSGSSSYGGTGDEKKLRREDAVDELIDMLKV